MTSTHKESVDRTDRLEAQLDQLKDQLAGYRGEARAAVRPRRALVGKWAAVAVAWLAAGSVSVITVLSLAEATAGVNDGKIAWVVFASFASALLATFLAATIRGE